ncbi:hypothetical protein CAPTEDRAFT_121840, partial [Capitella teleta]
FGFQSGRNTTQTLVSVVNRISNNHQSIIRIFMGRNNLWKIMKRPKCLGGTK